MDGTDLGIRFGRQKGEQVACLNAGFDLADAGVVADGDAGEECQRIVARKCEPRPLPNGALSAITRL